MPLGVVSKEEFEKEAEGCKRNGAFAIVDRSAKKRGKNVPDEMRAVISQSAIAGEPITDVADAFGVSESSVKAYKHDATSTATYQNPDKELKQKNDALRDFIVGRARNRLMEALKHITSDKLSAAKVRDVSAVAKDMSAVINNMSPSHNTTNVGAQFVFHVPKQKREDEFEVIDVGNE